MFRSDRPIKHFQIITENCVAGGSYRDIQRFSEIPENGIHTKKLQGPGEPSQSFSAIHRESQRFCQHDAQRITDDFLKLSEVMRTV